MTSVVEHVEDPSILDGKDVIGILPMHLAARCASITEIPLALTREDRERMQAGDLSIERLREIAGAPVRYCVRVDLGQYGRVHDARALAVIRESIKDAEYIGADMSALRRALESLGIQIEEDVS